VRGSLAGRLASLRGAEANDGDALRRSALAGRRQRMRAAQGGSKRPREKGDGEGERARKMGAGSSVEEDFSPSDFSDSETEAVEAGGKGKAFAAPLAGVSESAAKSMGIADTIRSELAAATAAAARKVLDTKRKRGDARHAPGELPSWDAEEEAERAAYRPQILYVSRTHSQIGQFVREIGKTVFGREARVVTLGSRKALCVHEEVLALGGDGRINEKCLEMQDAARKKGAGGAGEGAAAAPVVSIVGNGKELAEYVRKLSGRPDPALTHTGLGCPYLADPAAADAYRDVLLARVRDVEESAALGASLGTCAYYGSRRALKYAEVVTMPYNMLLHAGTRAASGVDLRGAVVVIDEAHNIIDAINGSHAASVTAEQLAAAYGVVRAYIGRYGGRMKPSNVQLASGLGEAFGALLRYVGGAAMYAAAVARSGGEASGEGRDRGRVSGASATGPPGASPPLPAVARTVQPLPPPAVEAPPAPGESLPGPSLSRASSPLTAFFGAGKALAAAAAAAAAAAGQGGPVLLVEHSAVPPPPAPLARPLGRPTPSAPPAVPRPPEAPSHAGPGDIVHSLSGLIAAAGLGELNLFRIRRYVEAVDLLRRLRGFAEAGARAAAAAASAASASVGAVTLHPRPNVGKGVGALPPAAPSYMTSVSAIQAAWSFFLTLLYQDSDGLVITHVPPPGGAEAGTRRQEEALDVPSARFVLLNPALPFRSVVESARSVILVGGTMQPVADITDQLFGHLPPSSVMTFSCGHIVPRESLAVLAVGAGPSAVPFDFRHAARREPRMMDELGRALASLATLVPAGLVVFLPSFEYEAMLMSHWARQPPGAAGADAGSHRARTAFSAAQGIVEASRGATTASRDAIAAAPLPPAPGGSILEQIQRRKAIFREPRGAAQLEAVLKAYAGVVLGTGSGVGGAGAEADECGSETSSAYNSDGGSTGGLSGHAFSLHSGGGRGAGASVGSGAGGGGVRRPPSGAMLFCVIGGKMSEGINFSDDLARAVVVVGLPYPNPTDPELRERMAYLDKRGAGGARGAEYYENLCMRAVNQSIGRSIRHAKDHAAILLLDGRYSQARIKSKLPGWIGDHVTDCASWGRVVASTAEFFRSTKGGAS